MPLIRVSLLEGKSPEYKQKVSDVIHRCIVEKISAPAEDKFQIFHEHSASSFFFAPTYLGIPHTQDLIIIQITMNEGRTVELKKGLYQGLADGLHEAVGVKKSDVFVSLVEVPKVNWSFGDGIAQYAT